VDSPGGNHVEDLFWESQGLVESPADILLPPLTLEQIAEVEARPGPIPPDVKDMLPVAKGFYGTSRLACGDFPGIDTFQRYGYPSVSVVSAYNLAERISLNDPDIRDELR
jgi:hypothetical protein